MVQCIYRPVRKADTRDYLQRRDLHLAHMPRIPRRRMVPRTSSQTAAPGNSVEWDVALDTPAITPVTKASCLYRSAMLLHYASGGISRSLEIGRSRADRVDRLTSEDRQRLTGIHSRLTRHCSERAGPPRCVRSADLVGRRGLSIVAEVWDGQVLRCGG